MTSASFVCGATTCVTAKAALSSAPSAPATCCWPSRRPNRPRSPERCKWRRPPPMPVRAMLFNALRFEAGWLLCVLGGSWIAAISGGGTAGLALLALGQTRRMAFHRAIRSIGAGAGWRTTCGRRLRFWRPSARCGTAARMAMDALAAVRHAGLSLACLAMALPSDGRRVRGDQRPTLLFGRRGAGQRKFGSVAFAGASGHLGRALPRH